MKRVIRFTKLRLVMVISSVVLILAGAAAYYVKGGFNLGIDFTAGLTVQIQIKPVAVEAPIENVRKSLAQIDKFDLQIVGNPDNQEYMIKVIAPQDDKGFQERMEAWIFELLSEAFDSENLIVKQSDFVGARYSQELIGQTISITLVALVLILLYTTFRFHFIFATAAVICLIHDVLFMAGVLAVFQLEFTATTIAAILTIIGYSLNDTIVIFDRIRENRGLLRDTDFESIINISITQSLSRTLLTSLTTLIAVVTIYVFGTSAIKDFALNLIIGVVVGTYSTIFIASSIVLGWQRSIDKRRKRRDMQKYGHPPPVPAAASTGPKEKPKEKPEERAKELAMAAEAPKAGGAAEVPGTSKIGGKVAVIRVQPTRIKSSRKKKKKKKKK